MPHVTTFLKSGQRTVPSLTKADRALIALSTGRAGRLKAIVFSDSDVQDSDCAVLLGKIMGAMKWSESEWMLIDKSEHPQLRLRHLPKGSYVLLCFGIKLTEAGINASIAFYDPVKIADYRVIVSDGLETLKEDPERKKRLWAALQKSVEP